MKRTTAMLLALSLAISIAGYWPEFDIRTLNHNVGAFGLRLNIMQAALMAHIAGQLYALAYLVAAPSLAIAQLIVGRAPER